jgi:hypothetical protein
LCGAGTRISALKNGIKTDRLALPIRDTDRTTFRVQTGWAKRPKIENGFAGGVRFVQTTYRGHASVDRCTRDFENPRARAILGRLDGQTIITVIRAIELKGHAHAADFTGVRSRARFTSRDRSDRDLCAGTADGIANIASAISAGAALDTRAFAADGRACNMRTVRSLRTSHASSRITPSFGCARAVGVAGTPHTCVVEGYQGIVAGEATRRSVAHDVAVGRAGAGLAARTAGGHIRVGHTRAGAVMETTSTFART